MPGKAPLPLNCWNDIIATGLEERPLAFGEKHLASTGWTPGKHVRFYTGPDCPAAADFESDIDVLLTTRWEDQTL